MSNIPHASKARKAVEDAHKRAIFAQMDTIADLIRIGVQNNVCSVMLYEEMFDEVQDLLKEKGYILEQTTQHEDANWKISW